MRSEDKLDVIEQVMPQFGGKMWVLVKHKNGFAFIPSFEDIFRIVRAICDCEDVKYPNGQGRNMVQDFLWDSCESDVNFELLALKYKIPFRRNGAPE
jgi:hypothetical protein